MRRVRWAAYGSPAAEQPLWDRLRKWHLAWAGRAAELPNGTGSVFTNGLQTALEMALVNALATAQSWFAGPEKLQRIKALCVSQWLGARLTTCSTLFPLHHSLALTRSAMEALRATCTNIKRIPSTR